MTVFKFCKRWPLMYLYLFLDDFRQLRTVQCTVHIWPTDHKGQGTDHRLKYILKRNLWCQYCSHHSQICRLRSSSLFPPDDKFKTYFYVWRVVLRKKKKMIRSQYYKLSSIQYLYNDFKLLRVSNKTHSTNNKTGISCYRDLCE